MKVIAIVVRSLRKGAFPSWDQHAGPSRRRRAVRRSASMRFAEELGRGGDVGASGV